MGSCLIILVRKNILLYTLLGNIKNISWKFELNPLIILRGVVFIICFCLSYQFYNQVTRLSILTIHRCYGLRNFAFWALFSLHFYSTYRVFLVRCFFLNGWHSVTSQDINKIPNVRSLLYMNILCGFEIFKIHWEIKKLQMLEKEVNFREFANNDNILQYRIQMVQH